MNALVAAHTTIDVSVILNLIPEKDDVMQNIAEATGVEFQADDAGHMHMLGRWHQILDGHNQIAQAIQVNNIGFVEGIPDAYQAFEEELPPEEKLPIAASSAAAVENSEKGAKDGPVLRRKDHDAVSSDVRAARSMSIFGSVEPLPSQLKISEEATNASGNSSDPRVLGLGLYSSAENVEELVEIHETSLDSLQARFCTGSIVAVGGDAVVNDCDRGLLMKSGFAQELSQCAGVGYRMECNRYALKNGRLKVGDVLATSGHRLCYRLILNAVGPNWDDFENKDDCEFTLASTYYNTFKIASDSNVKELNLPILCLDRDVPLEISARAFYHALRRFIREIPFANRRLTKIQLIEVDPSLVETFVEVVKCMPSEITQGPGGWGKLLSDSTCSSDETKGLATREAVKAGAKVDNAEKDTTGLSRSTSRLSRIDRNEVKSKLTKDKGGGELLTGEV